MKVKKDWWKTFFNNTIGQVMFSMPQERTRQEVQTILKETKLSKGSKILDLGCGVGRHSIEFAKQGMSVVGLDFSKDYVAEAKKKVKKERLNHQVSIIYGDMRKINQLFSTGEFDLKANKKQIVPETSNNVFKTTGYTMVPVGYYKLANPRLIHDDILIELTISLGTMQGVNPNAQIWAGLHGTITTP